MTTDQYGRAVIGVHDLCDMLYNGIDISKIREVEWDDEFDKYQSAVKTNHSSLPLFVPLKKYTSSVDKFDADMQSEWFMPPRYKELNIIEHVISLCPPENVDRAIVELELFIEYELLDVLRLCVYLVDTMRHHGILWGVGRGSSVSSYVLYLIGIHKIDSVKYDLDIAEFLK